ncbi:hypothetical protein [Saccharothrix coeruleofusca]|uniref:Uncharacterized protein n=1 Tax=Saccharothrix coeruleofusca TaxID=33919 RepID=A0A918ECH9_9PSEU|nr:hypothetical protein [Saccharothrix coeruleofusca]GGP40467.1 hypothetical protein GCM10010185_09400 [Saccharothrix coeruleofusca]
MSSASPEPSAPGAVPPSSPGSQPGSQPGRTGSAQPPQTSAAPVPDASEVPADRVDGSTLPDTYKQRVLVSGDGRTLQVIGLTGGCKNASAEVTAQSGDSVLITLVSTYYPPEGGGMCSQELRDIPLTVTLDAPLGDRRVILEAREQTA